MRIKNQQGMTLIEIMIVVAILAFIATLVTRTLLPKLEQAKVSLTKVNIKTLENSLDEFRFDNGFYPTSDQGLQALVQKPGSGRIPNNYPADGYLKDGKVPQDAFGCDFVYRSPGDHGHRYEISSLGDGCEEGGEGTQADIHSYEIVKGQGE